MNPKTTLAMGIMFLVTLLTIATLKIVKQPTAAELEGWKTKVVSELHDVDVENVTQVLFARDKDQFEFNYVESADRWQMTKPIDVVAQTSAVRDLFFDLKHLSRRTSAGSKDAKNEGLVVTKGPTDLTQYGLDSPSSSITLTYKPKGSDKSTKSVTLQVGAPTADKEGLYVKLDNEKYISVVNKSNLR